MALILASTQVGAICDVSGDKAVLHTEICFKPWGARSCRQPTINSVIRDAFEAMGRSDIGPLVALMTDDFAWIIEGQTSFSRRFEGKAAVKQDLLRPLFEAFATPYHFVDRRHHRRGRAGGRSGPRLGPHQMG